MGRFDQAAAAEARRLKKGDIADQGSGHGERGRREGEYRALPRQQGESDIQHGGNRQSGRFQNRQQKHPHGPEMDQHVREMFHKRSARDFFSL